MRKYFDERKRKLDTKVLYFMNTKRHAYSVILTEQELELTIKALLMLEAMILSESKRALDKGKVQESCEHLAKSEEAHAIVAKILSTSEFRSPGVSAGASRVST